MSQTSSSPVVPAAPPAASGKNYISNDIEIKGTLKFGGDLTSNGHIDGSVVAGGLLTVGIDGEVKGDVHASAVAVHGVVKGNITVSERCELRGNAELMGDLDAPRLIIEEGVTLVGNVKVQPKGGDQQRMAKPGAK